MNKTRKKQTKKKKQANDGMPLIVFVSLLGGGLFGYLVGEIGFAVRPHPVHWAAALAGVVLGGLTGWLIFHLKGDII